MRRVWLVCYRSPKPDHPEWHWLALCRTLASVKGVIQETWPKDTNIIIHVWEGTLQ